MNLFDLIAQTPGSRTLPPDPQCLPSSRHFASAVQACPLRLVLADDMLGCTTEIAYDKRSRLAGCLDLVRVPGELVWVEWAEASWLRVLHEVLETQSAAEITLGRSGVLIAADSSGRRGTIRTFWSTAAGTVRCAALIADFDLDRRLSASKSVAEIFDGAPASMTVSHDPALDTLLSRISFRFDPAWTAHYRSTKASLQEQTAVLQAALGSTAFSIPMLFASFLLLSVKNAAQQRIVNVNAHLLEHVVVTTSSEAQHVRYPTRGDVSTRPGQPLHPVRGHLARRGINLYWRSPHLRAGPLDFGAMPRSAPAANASVPCP